MSEERNLNGNPFSKSDDAQPQHTLRDALLRVQAALEGNTPPKEDDPPAPTETAPSPLPSIALDPTDTQSLAQKVDREKRKYLRDIQAHLLHAQVGLGAVHQVVDLVEVLYHPNSTDPSLNYVTPRQKTAWVSAEQVQHGINFLQERGRVPRVMYIEGLLPPLFARNLHTLALELEYETPLMVYLKDGLNGKLPPPPAAPQIPYNLRVETVNDVRGAEVWWYVWRNAYYDVSTLGVEPLYVARNVAAIAMGKHLDIILYLQDFPFGVARLTLHEQTAHLVSTALFREHNTPENFSLLLNVALHHAIAQGYTLVFAPGETEQERQIYREFGFMDFGSVVCYAAKASVHPTQTSQTDEHKPLVQPILNLRRNL